MRRSLEKGGMGEGGGGKGRSAGEFIFNLCLQKSPIMVNNFDSPGGGRGGSTSELICSSNCIAKLFALLENCFEQIK